MEEKALKYESKIKELIDELKKTKTEFEKQTKLMTQKL